MAYVPQSVQWVNSRKWRSARTRDVWVLQCRSDHWTHPQSLTNVVLGMIEALIIASDVSVEHTRIICTYEETGLPHSCSTPTKTFAITCSLPQLHFHLLKQLSSISPNLPSFHPHHNPYHPINQPQKTCMEKPKWRPIFPRGRTVTSQGQFGDQHGVLHDIDGSENGASLWTRAQTVTESQP